MEYHLAHIPAHDTIPCTCALREVVREVQVQLETIEMQKEMKKRQRVELDCIGGNGESSSMPSFRPSASANVGSIVGVGVGTSASSSGSGNVSLRPRIRKYRMDSFLCHALLLVPNHYLRA